MLIPIYVRKTIQHLLGENRVLDFSRHFRDWISDIRDSCGIRCSHSRASHLWLWYGWHYRGLFHVSNFPSGQECQVPKTYILTSRHRMMTQSVPVRQRPMVGGIAAGIEGISATAGPLLGGVLTDKISWRWCFYINLPLGFITIILISIFFENPRKSTHESLSRKEKAARLDLLGTAVFVPSITSLLLALQWGGSKYGWGDVRIIVLISLSMVLLAGFAFQQWRKGDDATLPPRVFGNRSLIAGFWFSFCNNSALSIVDYYVWSPPSHCTVYTSASLAIFQTV